MSDSIFELTEYESPFGNWMNTIPNVSIIIWGVETIKDGETDLFKISFGIVSNLAFKQASLELLTSNERSNSLYGLVKKINVEANSDRNNYTIKINRKSYDKHLKNSFPNKLLFYLELTSSALSKPIRSLDFTMKTLSVLVTGFAVDRVQANKNSLNDLMTFTVTIRSTNYDGKSLGIRMVQNNEQFLPAARLGPKLIPVTGEYTTGTLGIKRRFIEDRQLAGGGFFIWAWLDGDKVSTELLDFEKEFMDVPETLSGSCGIEYRDKIQCTRYGTRYGPVHWGSLKLENYAGWNQLISGGSITENDKEILIAMSENEGKLDSVQSYDNMPLTVGAMQKIVDREGRGEFSIQLFEFSKEQPKLYKTLFVDCGWSVRGDKNGNVKTYYKGKTGNDLKPLLRTSGFRAENFRKNVECRPFESLINACYNSKFQDKQVADFIRRLEKYLEESPVGKLHIISDYVKSQLGKATVLDHSVNRPGHVVEYFPKALDKLFAKYPNIVENPNNWGSKHKSYEQKLLDIYGPLRGKVVTLSNGNKVKPNDVMTDATNRYESLKKKLPIK